MESSNINEILGNYQNGLFDLNSKIFGAFNFQKYFDEIQKKSRAKIVKFQAYTHSIELCFPMWAHKMHNYMIGLT